MANWDLVLPYDSRATAWLSDEGYPCPPARPDNRLPTAPEVERAALELGISLDAALVVDWYGSDDCFTIRGDLRLELTLLRRLAESCGQLWVYPDTGNPAIIVEAEMDIERVAATWLSSLDVEDSWSYFHQALYSVTGE